MSTTNLSPTIVNAVKGMSTEMLRERLREYDVATKNKNLSPRDVEARHHIRVAVRKELERRETE